MSEGHLIDSGILAQILALIIEEDADYEIKEFRIGKTNLQTSRIELEVICRDSEQLNTVGDRLIRHGCYEKLVSDVKTLPAEGDGCVPDDFYSTTNHKTEVFLMGEWTEVKKQRMDAVIVIDEKSAICKKLRDVRAGDKVVCSSESVRVFPPARERESDMFGFMSGDVSSERSVDVAVDQIAEELEECRKSQRKVIAVAGPVIVHTGGSDALASIIRAGYIQGLLSGNALAVHDIEQVLFGTSLGLDMRRGRPIHDGHRHHMLAINRINRAGSIKRAVETGVLDRGIMYETVRAQIPYCLAGSIRDDGPLPGTVNDMIQAQKEYAEILKNSYMVLMLSTMLHAIGSGNMLPSWVKTVCVDINPAVVTKLSDRGSSQAIGIVSDVGFFLRALATRLDSIQSTADFPASEAGEARS